MGNLAADTAVERVDEHRYRATLNKDWEIWGPMGGYIASYALRAIGESTEFPRPASFSCHYLSVAAFDDIEIVVTPLRTSRVAGSYRAEILQGDRRILEATAWAIADGVEALEHDDAVARRCRARRVEEHRRVLRRRAGQPRPAVPVLEQLRVPAARVSKRWPPTEPLIPCGSNGSASSKATTRIHGSTRRALVLVDVQSWPAASRPHMYKQQQIYAPSLDLYVALHRATASEWLLADGYSAVGDGGLLGWTGRLWDADRRLVASGAGQLLCRPMSG